MTFTRRRALVLAVPLSLFLAAALPGSLLPFQGRAAVAQEGHAPAARVRTIPVEIRAMAPLIQVPGTVHSRQDAKVASEVSGRVVWVAEPGTRVVAGDPIARIDDQVVRLQLDELEAQIRSLQAQFDFQAREVARLEKLAATKSTPLSRLEEAVSRRDMLAQDLVRGRVQQQKLTIDRDRAEVRAPFAGQVAARMIEVGEYSVPGREVARLVAVDDIEVRAQVPVALANFLREGQEVDIAGDGGKASAAVTRLILVGEAQSRTFEIRLTPTSGRWIVGGAVRVSLPTAVETSVLAVHRDALVLRADGTSIFKVSDGKARHVPVHIGMEMGEWVEIRGELTPGDAVVVRGAETLRDGQAVEMEPVLRS